MKHILYIASSVFIILVSCQEGINKKSALKVTSKLLFGEWQLDSSSNIFSYRDKILINEKREAYWFLGNDGGSFYSKGEFLGNDTIKFKFEQKFIIQFQDSNHFLLKNSFGDCIDYYSRNPNQNIEANLKEYFAIDKYRKSLIGWWKVKKANEPIQLINYSGHYKTFTLNMNESGDALFFLENKLDSVVEYKYNVHVDNVDFNRGCIRGSNTEITFDKRGDMKMILGIMHDTIILERIFEIK
jgi:hypothetical protein